VIPRTVSIHLMDDAVTEQSRLISRIEGWAGRILASPRKEIGWHDEMLGNRGVYFLIGPDNNGNRNRVYVGQAGNIRDRLTRHNNDSNKDFWDRFIAITSCSGLDADQAGYLESQIA